MTSLEDMVASGRNQDAAFIFHSEQRRVLACLKLSEGASRWTLYFISTALSKMSVKETGMEGFSKVGVTPVSIWFPSQNLSS